MKASQRVVARRSSPRTPRCPPVTTSSRPYLIDRYFSYFWPQLGLSREEFLALGHHDASGEGFNMTALSMRLSGFRNGVSARHGEITRAMWHDLWPTWSRR